MKRRSFLGAMLAACAAPAIVKAEILMPGRGIIVPQQEIVRGPSYSSAFDEMTHYGVDEARGIDSAYIIFMHPGLHKELLGDAPTWNGMKIFESAEIPRSSYLKVPANCYDMSIDGRKLGSFGLAPMLTDHLGVPRMNADWMGMKADDRLAIPADEYLERYEQPPKKEKPPLLTKASINRAIRQLEQYKSAALAHGPGEDWPDDFRLAEM